MHGVKLTFADEVKSARLEPGGTELEVKKIDAGWRVTVARLDVHGMVVVE